MDRSERFFLQIIPDSWWHSPNWKLGGPVLSSVHFGLFVCVLVFEDAESGREDRGLERRICFQGFSFATLFTCLRPSFICNISAHFLTSCDNKIIFHVAYEFFSPTPSMCLELTALRSRAPCSMDWASRAPLHMKSSYTWVLAVTYFSVECMRHYVLDWAVRCCHFWSLNVINISEFMSLKL